MTRAILTAAQVAELERQVAAAEEEWQRTEKPGPAQANIAFKGIEYLRRLLDDRRETLALVRPFLLVRHERMAQGGGFVTTGHSCRFCEQEWTSEEKHADDCPLSVPVLQHART